MIRKSDEGGQSGILHMDDYITNIMTVGFILSTMITEVCYGEV